MQQFKNDKPTPLPVQALDHATGYLMAAATLHALAERKKTGRVLNAKLSLARTAHSMQQYRQTDANSDFNPQRESDLNSSIEQTTWGQARRVNFPLTFDTVSTHWDYPATALRSSPAQWM